MEAKEMRWGYGAAPSALGGEDSAGTRRGFTVILWLLFLFLFLPPAAVAAKNVILLIADGFGPAALGYAHAWVTQAEAVGPRKSGKEKFGAPQARPFFLEEFLRTARVGIVWTYAEDQVTNESPGSATAIATGRRTKAQYVGYGPNLEKSDSIAKIAHRSGRGVGLVTTTDLSDATPAAFAAYAESRRDSREISAQMLASGFEVLLGGGLNSFDIVLAEERGYTFLEDRTALAEARRRILADLKKPAQIRPALTGKYLGLFAGGEMGYVKERAESEPSLPEMVSFALDRLSAAPNGFFLMAEAGRIDHAAHANDAARLLGEVLELDEVVRLVSEFQKEHPDTLVLLTADHDTGGLAVGRGDPPKPYPTAADLREGRGVHWIGNSHTATPVLLAGRGPGSEKIRGVQHQHEIFSILKEALSP